MDFLDHVPDEFDHDLTSFSVGTMGEMAFVEFKHS
jgi:hypothetical protein